MLESKFIGDKIAQARKNVNFSQATLAENLFISPQAVGKWERGESLPDIITLNKMAEILGVDLNYFSESFTSTAQAKIQGEPQYLEKQIPSNTKKPSWDMSRGNWSGADFSGLKNLHDKFSFSNMQNCRFVGSELKDLLLKGNYIDGCDFSKSDFDGSFIEKSFFNKNSLQEVSLKNVEFIESYLSGCNLTWANMTGVIFRDGGIEKCNLSNSVFSGTSFKGSALYDLLFEGEMLDCYFENCKLTRVTFKNAVLSNTFFKCKSLKKIKFID